MCVSTLAEFLILIFHKSNTPLLVFLKETSELLCEKFCYWDVI